MDGRGGAAGSGSLLAWNSHGVLPLVRTCVLTKGRACAPSPSPPLHSCLAVKVNGGGQLTIPFHLGWGTPTAFPRSLTAPNTTPRRLKAAQP